MLKSGCTVVGDHVSRESDFDRPNEDLRFSRNIDVTQFQRRGRIPAVEPRAERGIDRGELGRGRAEIDIVDVVDDGEGLMDNLVGPE